MRILCKNYKCEFNRKLEKPTTILLRKNYVPLSKKDGLCEGECTKEFCGFDSVGIDTNKVVYSVAQCNKGTSSRCMKECLMNINTICTRDEILVDDLTTDGMTFWICKCQSDGKFKGHRDWFSLLQPDGTAKGGSISDSDADKENKNNKVNKSFPDHLRQRI